MKHSTSSVLVKIRFLPFQVNLKVAGKASMYLTFSCWSAFLEGRNIFLFSANSLDVLGNTDSLTSSHSITCLSRAARSTFFHAVIRSRSRLTWHGGQYSKSPLNFELPSISIPRPSFRTLFTHLSGFPSVPYFFFSSTSLTLFRYGFQASEHVLTTLLSFSLASLTVVSPLSHLPSVKYG